MLSERDLEVLSSLGWFTNQADRHDWHPDWAKPMDVGGRDGSYHSATLQKLTKLGFADDSGSYAVYMRRVNRYRITPAGRKALEDINGNG